jgi:hypothetical protein
LGSARWVGNAVAWEDKAASATKLVTTTGELRWAFGPPKGMKKGEPLILSPKECFRQIWGFRVLICVFALDE